MEGVPKSDASFVESDVWTRIFGRDAVINDFHERFVEALRHRLYPNTNLHLKQLADAIGRSESSVTRWWRGDSRILAEDLARIAQYFADRGDRAFLRAIFDERLLGTAAEGDGDELKGLLRSVLAALPAADEDIPQETVLWVTSEGAIVPAPLGHTEYVARALHLPAGVGNLVRYATAILGWIAVAADAGGVVIVRHDGRRVAPLAVECLCEWLTRRRAHAPAVVRLVQIEGSWVEARHDSVDLAVAALEKLAFIVSKPRRPWSVTRLPLDAITHDRLQLLLRVHRETPDQVIHTAAAVGAFTDSSLFSVDGENIISLFVAPRYLVSRELEGQNVMSIPDTDYAMMVHSRVLKAATEGPVYCELAGTLNNEYLRYLNLALSVPGAHGKVLTSTVVLEHEIMP
jgi:transcriptional regulator with XRE-family HTH domain